MLLEDTDASDTPCALLPRGTYASLLYHGTHADADVHYEKLLGFCEQKGYRFLDDSVEITYIDYGLTNRTEDFLTEIQLRVSFKD